MMSYTGILFVWFTGFRDLILSQRLVGVMGTGAEMNLVVRALVERFGTGVMLYWKLATLAVFTAAWLLLRRRHKAISQRVIAIGILAYAALGLWWDILSL